MAPLRGRCEAGGEPDIEWIELPADKYPIGSQPDDKEAFANEQPAHWFQCGKLWVSRFPVTVAQFEATGWEWCLDTPRKYGEWGGAVFSETAEQALERSQAGSSRALRGGSWANGTRGCRPAYRDAAGSKQGCLRHGREAGRLGYASPSNHRQSTRMHGLSSDAK